MSVYEKIRTGLIEAIEYERSNAQGENAKPHREKGQAGNAFPVIDLFATGENILRLRKEAGLSVKDLQAYFGFSDPQAVYAWQRGTSLPSVDNLIALARILGVTIDDILVVQDPYPSALPKNGQDIQ